MPALPRREFLSACSAAALSLGLPWPAQAAGQGVRARYFEQLKSGRVRCLTCPYRCLLDRNQRGHCRSMVNRDGVLRSMAFGNPAILRLDPVEKWPLYHFRPGAKILALGTGGCNLRCGYCQNWQLSQRRPENLKTFDLPPTRVAERVRKYDADGVGFAYTEPVSALEFSLAIAERTRDAGLATVAGTALLSEPGPAADLARAFDALSVTLKAGSDAVHEQLTNLPLAPVLRNLEAVRDSGTWLEITTLLVPTINDSDVEIRAVARFVARTLGHDVPLHFSRFFPDYKLRNLPPTPLATLVRARDIAHAEGLRFVYLGNTPGHAAQNTTCPGCSSRLMLRIGTDLLENKLTGSGVCPDCERAIAGIWA